MSIGLCLRRSKVRATKEDEVGLIKSVLAPGKSELLVKAPSRFVDPLLDSEENGELPLEKYFAVKQSTQHGVSKR